MSRKIPRINRCYCINFRRVANTLTKYYDFAFASLNLTASQFSLLADIDYLQVCNKSELAQCAHLDRTTIIRNLRVLKQKKLVEESAEENSRNNRVRLTDAGEKVLEEGTVYWKKAQNHFKQVLGEETSIMLMKILNQIESAEQLLEGYVYETGNDE